MLKRAVITFSAATLLAAQVCAEETPVTLRADSLTYDRKDDLVQASGKVEMLWSGAHLYADIARYWREKGLVTAQGDVRLDRGDDTFSGDRVELSVDDKKGVIHKGRMFIKQQNIHVNGDRFEKTGDQDYRVKNASITTCENPSSGWQFRVEDLELTVDGFATGKNARLYLADTPVFWLPYFVFPAKVERQSGFLFPSFGNSSKKGVFIEIPYYFAISPSMDLTLSADLQSKRGAGLGFEHRYLGVNEGYGTSRGYVIYDQEQSRVRGDLELKQQYNFSQNTYLRADVSQTLDRAFFSDYGTMSGDYNRQYLQSLAFMSHTAGSSLFTGGIDYINNLDAPDNKNSLQSLPFATFNATGSPLLKSPLYYSFAAHATNFEQVTGWRGQRLTLAPALSLPVSTGFASGVMSAGYEERLYSADNGSSSGESKNRGVARFDASVESSFARVYDSRLFGMERVRHSLTPRLSYSLIEKKNQDDLPFFDYNDRLPGGGMVNLSLHNTITGRSSSPNGQEYRDLARFSLSQGYQSSGTRRELLALVDDGRRFTDTRLVAELFPMPLWKIYTDDRISPYSGTVTNAAVGTELGKREGTSASLEYRHAEGLLDYISGRVKYADFRPFVLGVEGRYSMDRAAFLETLYSVEYKHQCWSLTLSYRDRLDNREFSFSFNLSGLGNIKLL